MTTTNEIVLLKEYRDLIAKNYDLRTRISIDIGSHEQTIRRWSVSNSPKLVTEAFLNSLKKNLGLKIEISELTETVPSHFPHLHEA